MSDYLQEIEEAYGRCRERFSMLSPRDWQLAQDWEKAGIPLHIVIRSIQECCKKYKAKRRPDNINTLLYFDQEVRKQFAGWHASRVGASGTATTGPELLQQNERDLAIERCELIIAKFEAARAGANPQLRTAIALVVDAVFQHLIQVEGTGDASQTDGFLRALATQFDPSLVSATAWETKEKMLQAFRKEWAGSPLTLADFERLLVKELYDQMGLPKLTLYPL
jgi:hypothetical protein